MLTLSGVETTSFPGVKFSKNENFLPVLENDDEKDVAGVAEGNNYVKRKNVPATFRSSWSGGPGQHAAP